MTGYDYWSTSTQSERKKILQNDRDTRDTFHSRAIADADLLAQGRFQKETASRVIGSGGPTYPAISSGPWAEGDPGLPDALTDQFGDINAMEPVGSAQEIEASLPDAADPEVSHHLHASAEQRDGQGGGRRRVALPASSQPFRRSFKRRF